MPDQPEDVRIGGTLYGSIIFNSATGKYVFTAAPDSRGSLDFILHARDGDGDAVDSGKAFTITVTRAEDPDLPTHLGGNRNERFYEANLTDEDGRTPGTDPDQAALTNIIAVPAGYRVDTQGWTDDGAGGWTRQGSYGYNTYKGGVLSYTLESAPYITGDGKNISQDLFPGTVLNDGWENTFNLDVKISEGDDVTDH